MIICKIHVQYSMVISATSRPVHYIFNIVLVKTINCIVHSQCTMKLIFDALASQVLTIKMPYTYIELTFNTWCL